MFRAHASTNPFEPIGRQPPDVDDAVIEIIRPEAGKYRSRTVVSRSRSRGTGRYPSWKMGRMIQWESPNELNAFRLLDADPAVRAFHEQPLVVRFVLDQKNHLHYPDLLVEWRSGRRELWEIKPACEARRPEICARTQLLESRLPRHGFEYRMVIGEDLKREPRLSTALTILKYGRPPIEDEDRERIRQLLLVVPTVRWASTLDADLGPRSRSILSRLVLEGDLTFDRDQNLTAMTEFTSTTSAEFSR